MKTNKQRAELIIKKANELKINNLTEVPQPKKKIVWWKVITAISCAFVVLVGALVGLIVGLANSGYNIDKMYIANFNSYTAIGSGHINSNEQTASASGMNIAYAASNGGSDSYLMGQKEDGTFEKIAFSKTQNGKPEKQQKGYVTQVHSFTNFTIFEWSSNINYYSPSEISKNKTFFDYDFSNAKIKTYVIDNRTGKIFNLSILGMDGTTFEANLIYGFYGFDGGDCFYYSIGHSEGGGTITYYKVSIEDGLLKVEEVINSNMINFEKTSTFSDKFGNLYLSDNHYYGNGNSVFEDKEIIPVKYIISNGNVIDVNNNVFRSVNGIVYTKDKTLKINENGQFVENTFTDCDLILSKENIVRKEGNVEYYYGNPSSKSGETMLKNIYKLTWINEEEYSYEVIPVDEYTKTFVTTSDKIYFLNEKEIFAIEIETGKKIEQDIGSDYIFNNIQTDNLGNVLFEGITKEGMRSVNGIIDNDGNTFVLTTNRKYVVYYIKPLN